MNKMEERKRTISSTGVSNTSTPVKLQKLKGIQILYLYLKYFFINT